MTKDRINYRILRSDKEKHDYIKVFADDYANTEKALVEYFATIYDDKNIAALVPSLVVWSLHNNANKSGYTTILQDDTNLPFSLIVQIKRM